MQKGGSLGQGLLSPLQTIETRTADPRAPEPSAARLGPRGFSAEVVDSLGGVFVCRHFYSVVYSSKNEGLGHNFITYNFTTASEVKINSYWS